MTRREEIQTNIDQLEDLILDIEDMQGDVDNSRDRRELANAMSSIRKIKNSKEYLLEVLEDKQND